MKRNMDAVFTWSKRLSFLDNWSAIKEARTIYRTIDNKGVNRLIMFSGLYSIRMAFYELDGKSCF